MKRILPPNKTRAASTADYGAECICRRDKVYVTNSITAAKMFAAMHPSGKGCVYVVNPIGVVEPDPDFIETEGDGIKSYQCDEAEVLSVIKMRPLQIQLIQQAVMCI